VIVFNFDVLARPADSLATRQPYSDGRAIWGALFEKYMGRMILVCNDVYDRSQFMDWLKREQFKASMLDFIDQTDPVLKAEAVHRIGSAAGRINWYVDNDPSTCQETLKLGIPTLVVACPYIVRPEWDSGRKIKEWGNLVDEMDSQALKSAERTWRDE
jgi:hypothetical protein